MHTEAPKFVHIADVVPRPGLLRAWERKRHTRAHWFVECVAEFMGAFLYTYAGVGATAAMVIGNSSNQPQLGSVLQVGAAYAMGIVFALTGFPWRKVPGFIVSQIFGGYVACLLAYLQWKGNILALEAALEEAGTLAAINFTPNGPAGIFGLYTLPGANLGYVFANEFFVDIFLGLVIWACADPSNFFCPPSSAPYTIGFAYAVAIWGYSPNGLAANTARDLGGRFAAMTIWGRAASGGRYAAIAALTNFVSMLIAAAFYEVFFTDSSRVLPPAQRDFLFGHEAHAEHKENMCKATRAHFSESTFTHEHEKVDVLHQEA
ncbi:hypothetical protein M0805_002376 [Coniferiporia weirii]|nr:hypothetical protein M0805_002376 [Coniferiporia weirii]